MYTPASTECRQIVSNVLTCDIRFWTVLKTWSHVVEHERSVGSAHGVILARIQSQLQHDTVIHDRDTGVKLRLLCSPALLVFGPDHEFGVHL